jgi:hypothetical protein
MRFTTYTLAFACLLSASANAADFTGIYRGKTTVTKASGQTQYCGSGRDVSYTVKGDTISSRNTSGKVAPDGSFTLSGSINNDGDILTVKGAISGTSLKGTWSVPGRQAQCGGDVVAEKASQ